MIHSNNFLFASGIFVGSASNQKIGIPLVEGGGGGSKFFLFLYLVLIFFIVFDGLRDASIFSSQLSLIREFTVLVLGAVSFFVRIPVRRNFILVGNIFLFLSFSWGIWSSIFPFYPELRSISNPIVVIYRAFQYFILLRVFSCFTHLTGLSIDCLIKFFLISLCFFSVVSPFLYFYPPFFIIDNFKQWGRIGIGYPTMDAQIFCFGLVFLMAGFRLFKSKFYNLVVVLILFFGVFIQVTGTGIATLFILIFYYFFTCGRNKVRVLILFVVLAFYLFFSYLSFSYYESENLKDVLWLANDKFESLKGGVVSTSVQMRQEQAELLSSYTNISLESFLFGIGSKIYVENQYNFSLYAFGFIGFLSFLIFIFSVFIGGVARFKFDGGLLLISMAVFSLSSYTLVTFYLYPLYASMAFFVATSNFSIDKNYA